MKEISYSSSAELLDSLKFCVIDLETTGGNPETEKIVLLFLNFPNAHFEHGLRTTK